MDKKLIILISFLLFSLTSSGPRTSGLTRTVIVSPPPVAETITLSTRIAFPTAEGYGRNTTGGRGGSIVKVTNLNNSGTGSLRDALGQTGPRIIIFSVSGYINLTSPLYIDVGNGNVTIAGETAPNGGITLRNFGLEINESNVIVRHIRARVGTANSNVKGFRIINWTAGKAMKNIILDHVSSSWGTDENWAISGGGGTGTVQDVTLQYSILSENLGSGAALIYIRTSRTSFYKNYLANNPDRLFHSSVCGADFEIINNLFYNNQRGTTITEEGTVDIIGNYYRNTTVSALEEAIRYAKNIYNCPDGDPALGQIYQTENYITGFSPGTINSKWLTYDVGHRVHTDSYITPLAYSTDLDILSDVGANLTIDAVDARLFTEYANGTGAIISNETSVGGYPILPTGSPYTDNNNDGIDDSWASAHSIMDASEIKSSYTIGSNTIVNNAGYSALEIFLADRAGDFDRLTGTTPPTCSDGIQNGDETGIDCGGSCSPCGSGGIETSTGAGARAFMNYLLTD